MVTKGPYLVCMFSVIRKVRTTQNALHEKYCQDVREITMPLLLLMIFLVLFHCDIIMTPLYDIQFEYKIEILSLNYLF